MEYKYKWYIPDAYLHSRGTGYFTSHEGCAFINETDRDAHVRFTFYFQDLSLIHILPVGTIPSPPSYST